MVRVDTVLELVNFISNKEQSGNTMKIPQYNLIIELVNIDILKKTYGLPEEYQPGQPLPRVSYEITKKIMDDLKHLKVRMGVDVPVLTLNQYGRADIPTDYLHLSSARYRYFTKNKCGNAVEKTNDIELLTDAQIGDRLGNSITMPTKKHPCMAIYSNYFQFYPEDLKQVELTYLRLPRTPYYNATLVSGANEDYYDFSETGSQHFEYPTDTLSDIVMKILSYIGINIREQQVTQYAEMKSEKGD